MTHVDNHTLGALVEDHLGELLNVIQSPGNMLVESVKANYGTTNNSGAIDNNNSTAIRDVLESTLAGLSGMRVVVNMSFVLLPCGTDDAITLSQFPDFESYMYALAAALSGEINDASKVEDLRQDFTSDSTNVDARLESNTVTKTHFDEVIAAMLGFGFPDPLVNFLTDLTWNEEDRLPNINLEYVALVASSGNFSLDYPMYPAALDFVVGVSALTRGERYSNDGEIQEEGDWYELNAGMSLFYRGTSFSAPVVSLFSALDLAQTEPCFTDNQLNANRPGLIFGYPNLGFPQNVSLDYAYSQNNCPYP